MKNRIFAFLGVVVLCLTLIIPASAADTFIYGETSLFGDVTELDKYAQKIEDNYGYSVFVAVVESTGNMTDYEYGKELYDNNAAKDNGLVLIYNYGEKAYEFYRAGEAEVVFTDDILENRLWKAFSDNESYFTCSVSFYREVESILADNAGVVGETEAKTALVVDNADVLTDEEEYSFAARLEELGRKHELEIVILTVDSYEGKDPQAFADDYYDYNGYGYGETDNGYIIVLNTGKYDGNRNIAISASGTASELLTDTETDVIIEMMINPVKNEDYAGAFDTFISESESSLEGGIS